MVISSHFLAGAAIGRATGNPILAVVIGFVFHFVMDLVPHWNYGYKALKKTKTLLLILLDPFLAFALFMAIGLVRGYDFSTWLVAFAGGVACFLPDLIEFVIRVFKIKSLAFFLYFHRFLHWFKKSPGDIWESGEETFTKRGIVLGVLSQIPFILISIYFLFI